MQNVENESVEPSNPVNPAILALSREELKKYIEIFFDVQHEHLKNFLGFIKDKMGACAQPYSYNPQLFDLMKEYFDLGTAMTTEFVRRKILLPDMAELNRLQTDISDHERIVDRYVSFIRQEDHPEFARTWSSEDKGAITMFIEAFISSFRMLADPRIINSIIQSERNLVVDTVNTAKYEAGLMSSSLLCSVDGRSEDQIIAIEFYRSRLEDDHGLICQMIEEGLNRLKLCAKAGFTSYYTAHTLLHYLEPQHSFILSMFGVGQDYIVKSKAKFIEDFKTSEILSEDIIGKYFKLNLEIAGQKYTGIDRFMIDSRIDLIEAHSWSLMEDYLNFIYGVESDDGHSYAS